MLLITSLTSFHVGWLINTWEIVFESTRSSRSTLLMGTAAQMKRLAGSTCKGEKYTQTFDVYHDWQYILMVFSRSELFVNRKHASQVSYFSFFLFSSAVSLIFSPQILAMMLNQFMACMRCSELTSKENPIMLADFEFVRGRKSMLLFALLFFHASKIFLMLCFRQLFAVHRLLHGESPSDERKI